jgi:hypothetical protein
MYVRLCMCVLVCVCVCVCVYTHRGCDNTPNPLQHGGIRHYSGVTAVLQWCYSGVTVVLQWCYSGVTMVLQWCYNGVTVVLQWCHSDLLLGLLEELVASDRRTHHTEQCR